MTTQPAPPPGRFVLQEWRPDKPAALDDLPAGALGPALAMLARLKAHAGADPGMPWTFFACREDDADTVNILNLWSCGIARVCTGFETSTGEPAYYIARPA